MSWRSLQQREVIESQRRVVSAADQHIATRGKGRDRAGMFVGLTDLGLVGNIDESNAIV